MPFPFGTKKELSKDAPGDPPPDTVLVESAAADPLRQLAERLGEAEATLREANRQLVDHLLTQSAAPAPAAAPLPAAVVERLDALSQRLDRLAAAPREPAAPPPAIASGPSDPSALAAIVQPLLDKLAQIEAHLAAPRPDAAAAAEAAVAQLRAAIHEHNETTAAAFRQLWQQTENGLRQIVEYVRPPENDAQAPASAAEWQRAILGPALAENAAIAFQRQQLIEGVLAGNAAACALAGQLLVFQSAVPERMPTLLKDIGEAFYRWQPKARPSANKLEETLAAWLVRACDDAGIPNTIELVNPGERFDAGRHNANQRGVEITDVHGWIVLRDNGRVYTKALVSVK